MSIKDHTEFDVWILACEIRDRIVAILKTPALRDRELLWLRVQLRKAANSACTNAAEGYARYYPKEFARFLGISKASLAEIKNHLLEPEIRESVRPEELQDLLQLVDRCLKATKGMIRYLVTAEAPRPRSPGPKSRPNPARKPGAGTGEPRKPENHRT